MSSLLFLIPIALLMTIVSLYVFIWAIKSGQYEDLDRDARNILFDQEDGRTDGYHGQSHSVNDQATKRLD